MEAAPLSREIRRFGLGLGLFLLVFSCLTGGVLARRYLNIDANLVQTTRALHDRGASLTVEGCVSEAISWWQGCEDGDTVCDGLVGHIAKACLSGADRGDACASLGQERHSTHYDFEGCVARGFNPREARDRASRKVTNACGDAYRAVDEWCESLVSP